MAHTSTSTEETAVARPDPPGVITTPKQFTESLARWSERNFHVLSAFTSISGLPAQHAIIASLVQITTDPAIGEVYDGSGGMPFLKNDEVALAKIGLRKIAECAGVSTSTIRTDPRTIPFFWEIKAVGTYRGVDGAVVTREATMEWDLRDTSDRIKGFTANQIKEARKHGLRNCEARAVNAVIRECGCGVKQKYTRKELEKPFVVLRVVFQPDMRDPETRRLVTEKALGGTNALYAPSQAARGEIIDAEVEPARPVGQGTTQPAPAAQPPATDELPEGAVRIVKVENKSGETKGKKWTRFVIVDSNGAEHSTFDTELADAAKRFVASKAWVEIDEEADGAYKNLIGIMPAGQQPKLPSVDAL